MEGEVSEHTCANCEELQQRVEELEDALGNAVLELDNLEDLFMAVKEQADRGENGAYDAKRNAGKVL